ncbi:8510_t:CDS:2 [Gigaspora rosea]|nr:8510_t:CDS:2 [Gigaspora rosea]
MVWDILTLEFKVTLPTEWDVCCTRNLVINDKGTLLAVWFKESIYLYSVDFQLFLSSSKPYIIKHNFVFYVRVDFGPELHEVDKLDVRNLDELLKDKINNMSSKLVAEEVLKEIEENGSSKLEFNDEKWIIKKIDSWFSSYDTSDSKVAEGVLISYNTSNVKDAESVLKEIKENRENN